MKTIHKFPIFRSCRLTLPKDAMFCHFDVQNNELYIWFLVDYSKGLEEREFEVLGTGWEIPSGAEYLGTALQGDLVWHLFEILAEEDDNDLL